MKFLRPLIFSPLLALILSGCGSSFSSVKNWFSDDQTAVVAYDTNTLWQLKMGREYVAQGRYELAKEQYLMALASSNDPETREMASHELHAVDMMIKTQR